MNTASCCPSLIPLSRPLHRRLLDGVAQTWFELLGAWRRHAEVRRQRREADAVADMNELLLRDVGAPDWLIAEAEARRNVERLLHSELWRESSVGRLRGLL
jgi:hypothetical protein